MKQPEYPIELAKYSQPLEKDETDTLKHKIELYIFGIICSVLFFGLIIGLFLYNANVWDIIISGGVGLFMCATSILYLRKRSKDYRQDINNGYKIVYTGKVESKREDSSGYNSIYYLTILGTELSVDFDHWKDLRVDHTIEIHFAPNSKHIFKLIPLN